MSITLKPYPEYRDSGLPWLGEIPAHWDVRRNGRLFAQRIETGFPHLPILEVSLRTGVRVRDMDNGARKQIMSDFDKYKRAAHGDIAYNMMRMWQGAVGPAPTDGLVSPAYVVVRPYPEVESRYYSYLFRTDAYMSEVNKFSRGIVTDRNRLYWEEFKQMPSAFPSLSEQQKIANFLDYHGHSVSRLIRTKQQLIEILNEQKQAIIYRAVTRGLDPDTPTKPTGLDWLREVPEHWEILRLKHVAAVTLGKMLKTSPDEGDQLKPYLRSANIQWMRPNLEDVAEMWFSRPEMETLRLERGDVLVSEGGEVGRACLWSDQLEECYIQNAVHRITPQLRVRSEFLLYQLFLMGKGGYLESIVNRVSIAHLTREKLANIEFIVPPVVEQDKLLHLIYEESKTVDDAIQRARREIDLILEYRTRLISDVVTGKLDVREAELPESVVGEEEAKISPNGIESGIVEELLDTEEVRNADL